MSRAALVVGIDYYEYGSPLKACVSDAESIRNVLDRHANGDKNFKQVTTLLGKDARTKVTRMTLKDQIRDLFSEDHEVALFYFAGHGHMEASGGYLLTTESTRGDDGVSLSEVLTFVSTSPAKSKIIVLDSCHSGFAGQMPNVDGVSLLAEGVSILTASTSTQKSFEKDGRGVFTSLFVSAMQGAASNIEGDVTLGLVYAHLDQALGVTNQRPVFKTNVKTFVSLRKNAPAIAKEDLLKLDKLFPKSGHEFRLDPSYEPQDEGRTSGMPRADKANCAVFAVLQRFNKNALVEPRGASKPHMWHAVMESKWCVLTPLGEHYRSMVESGAI